MNRMSRKLLSTSALCAALAIAALPATLAIEDGVPTLKWSSAHAHGGDGDGGGGGGGDSGGDGGGG
ncbi:MAG: hypothetical protein IBJ07_07415, partial [Rhizobiaceae bacterium]|nr:hypothetical protein [Rhizobiaceae bacterium]